MVAPLSEGLCSAQTLAASPRLPISGSSNVRQRPPQLLRGAEQSVLGGLFRGMQNLAHGPQLQSVVMLQLEYHALPGRQLLQRTVDTLTQLTSHQVTLRARSCPAVRHLLQHDRLAVRLILEHRGILFSHMLLT